MQDSWFIKICSYELVSLTDLYIIVQEIKAHNKRSHQIIPEIKIKCNKPHEKLVSCTKSNNILYIKMMASVTTDRKKMVRQ